ncbi:hypothetical protein ABKN59_002387 [Abortiporus biennis]
MYSLAAVRRSAAHASRASRGVVVPLRYSSTMHDNDPELLDKEKSRNMRKVQHKTSTPIDNAPGWNQTLASASEAAVKADRSELDPSELTQRTVEYVRQRHAEEDASESNGELRVDATEATYEKEEVIGPLKDRGHKETTETSSFKEQTQPL